jgi:hypothetical protein
MSLYTDIRALDQVCLKCVFLDLLAQLPERFGARVHGYALMPNHFHLLVESVRGSEPTLGLVAHFTQSVR